jgi:hypothetical protein
VSTPVQHVAPHDLDHQIARVAWALLFIMLGCIGLLQSVPQGTWLIGTGLILMGAQAVRFMNHIRVRTFSFVLGIAAFAFGLAAFVGTDLPVLPIVLVLIGVSILLPARLGGEHVYGAATA